MSDDKRIGRIRAVCSENQSIAQAFETAFTNLSRVNNLCKIYRESPGKGKGRKSVHQSDILRSAVILVHATLEDCLRTLSLYFLPESSIELLNSVALSGLNELGRPEKFNLGDLAKFKGKTIDEVIKKSVEEHLDRKSYNCVNDIITALKLFGLDPDNYRKYYSQFNDMITRRHQIVHRGDRVKKPGRGKQYAETIRLNTVEEWLNDTVGFIVNISHDLLDDPTSLQLIVDNIPLTMQPREIKGSGA
ncbi:MAG: HEPN domain-containing protein [Candidatus Omnitrophota bacterium]|jgi:uncharacterized protein (UPF0297 family)